MEWVKSLAVQIQAFKMAAVHSTENLMSVFSQTPSGFLFSPNVAAIKLVLWMWWFVCVLFNSHACHLILQ